MHDSVHLNRVTPQNERIYLIVKTTVQLSHPAAMELVLRKRIAANIYNKQVGMGPDSAVACCCLVTQSCPTLCEPMDCNRPGSFAHGTFQARITGGDCHFLFQGISPTWGWSSISYVSCIEGRFFTDSSLVAQLVRNPPAVQEASVRFLGWEDPLEKG